MFENVFDLSEFRNKIAVFRNREHAGKILADMLTSYRNKNAIIFGIPAGGLPVASEISKKLALPLDVVVVSKITLPWNTEVGYGAVAFDGTVSLNEKMIINTGLNDAQVHEGIQKTLLKVKKRIIAFRGDRSFPELAGRSVILVDDGIASGFTISVAVKALKNAKADHIIIAVPTGHWDAIINVVPQVDSLYCANIRSGWSFAVADAYESWSDVDENEVIELLKDFSKSN
jgi:putative phosphoribosyl transferase